MRLHRLLQCAWGPGTSAGVLPWSTASSLRGQLQKSGGASIAAACEPRLPSAIVRLHAPPGQQRGPTVGRCRDRQATYVRALSMSSALRVRTASATSGLLLQPSANRAMSSAGSSEEEVIVYSSKFESVLRAFSAGSVVQGGACTLMAAAVSLHPAAADSSLLPGECAGEACNAIWRCV